jgi:hypothetical protein
MKRANSPKRTEAASGAAGKKFDFHLSRDPSCNRFGTIGGWLMLLSLPVLVTLFSLWFRALLPPSISPKTILVCAAFAAAVTIFLFFCTKDYLNNSRVRRSSPEIEGKQLLDETADSL